MASSLIATIHRRAPVLVGPAKPTPHQFKPLSDIDNQQGNRFHISVLQFFRNNSSMVGRDPARVIKEGLAEALVYYYPLAGRLREGPAGKLVVECNGEGVMFVDADADVRLEQFGDPPVAPPSCAADFIYAVQGSRGLLGCPLMLIQVTRLACGGFILGIRVNHTLCDAGGLAQFLIAAGEMSQGASAPSVHPVWARELLNARTPPRITHLHREFDKVKVIDNKCALPPTDQMVRRYVFFGQSEMLALKKQLPPHLRRSSTFDIITACNWRSRSIALGLHPEQEVRATFAMSVQGKFNPPLPAGYYGNSFATPTAITTAGTLCAKPLAYALELVREAKSKVSAEYLQSVADLMVLRGRPHHLMVHTYFASDVTRAKFDQVDFGWGKPVYDTQVLAGRSSFYVKAKNNSGEHGILVSVCLPPPEMERFMMELRKITEDPVVEPHRGVPISSSL